MMFQDLEGDANIGIGGGTDADDDVEFITMEDGEIPDDFLLEMQDSAPNQLDILKQVSSNP